MERSANRLIDHTKLVPGMYIASINGDVTVYELRFCRPNKGPFLTVEAQHTLSHLYEQILENIDDRNAVLWFGASASCSGFYMVCRSIAHSDAIAMVSQATEIIANWDKEIPGVSAKECSDIERHDLISAKKWAQMFISKVKNITQDMLVYPC